MQHRGRTLLFLCLLCLARTAAAYELHNSLAVDLYRPRDRAWSNSFGFDAQYGGWFRSHVAATFGIGTLLLHPNPDIILSSLGPGAAPETDVTGRTVVGLTPSFLAGPSLWCAVPLPGVLSLSAELDGRYAFNPHGPSLYGSRTLDDGSVESYRERIDLADGIVLRGAAHIEAALHASAKAFAGCAWQRTASGFEASVQDRAAGRFDVDGLIIRAGLRGAW